MGLLDLFQTKKQRRRQLQQKPLPDHVLEWMKNIPAYQNVPDQLRDTLNGHMQVLLDEKTFEGCGGLKVNDQMRYMVTLHAAKLLLGGISDYYPDLRSILLYPDTYHAPFRKNRNGFVVTEGVESRIGESWSRGHVVLAWNAVWEGCSRNDGYNVVFHEFAHQLDHEYGLSEQIEACQYPHNSEPELIMNWYREYQHYLRRLRRHQQPLVLDPYAATSAAEYFAVATESFFEKPQELRRIYPDLYDLMVDFYQLDMADWKREIDDK